MAWTSGFTQTPEGGLIVRTGTEAGVFTFVLLRPDGTTIGTFPDTRERIGRNLVAGSSMPSVRIHRGELWLRPVPACLCRPARMT